MDARRWQQVKDLLALALRRTGSDRDSFLSEACGADTDLRAQVESMLAAGHAPDRLMDSTPKDPLSAGTRLGPNELQALIGAGGMGEVYKGRDTRLNRTVAIKILPSQHRDDPDRRRRFEREARAIAALADPHICVLYDVGHHDGTDFLVMEYTEFALIAGAHHGGMQRILRPARKRS
jgi:eukaryotic-like serine/threonine-protein kinase